MIDLTYYGSVDEANAYFAARLHEHAWTASSSVKRSNALIAARRLIDGLNFKGCKHTVYTLLLASPDADADAIRQAEASQPLEFPRGADITVPESIRIAEYEIAHALLDDKDPELDLETLAVTTVNYGGAKTSFERSQMPIEHIVNLIPSAMAFRMLSPFLRDDDAVKLLRVS